MMKNKIILLAIFLILLTGNVLSHDYVPGTAQDHPILLKGGNLYTVSSGILENTDLLFENGQIIEIAKDIAPPLNCEIIDISGKNVYPGIIASNSSIGLTEIGDLSVTNDKSEIGKNNADLLTSVAYNPDSEIIPTIRANGVTTALIVPGGSLVTGRSCLVNMDGWTVEDAMVKQTVGLHLNWPRMRIINAWWMEKSVEEQKKENSENARKIYDIFDKAKAYYLAKSAGKSIDQDARYEAMYPVFSGDMPVFINANNYLQIENAVRFSQKYSIKMILVGGNDALKTAELLKENNIPVILSKTQSLPHRTDYSYDYKYTRPAKLHEAGVKFCISYGSASSTRNLPFQASQAVAFGLPADVALRSITLSTAEILGVDDKLGSLEVGKLATIVVSKGDILDHLTHQVEIEFINGKAVDLNSKHKELYQKYREKSL